MKQNIKAIGCILAALSIGATAFAGAKHVPVTPDPICAVPFTGTVSVGYDTDLYQRGQQIGEDVINGGVAIDYSLSDGVSLAVGGAYSNITDPAIGDRLVTSGWANFGLAGLDAGIGLNWYYYPELDGALDDSLEAGIRLGTDLGIAYVGFGYYYDFEAEGNYLQLGLSKTIPLSDCLDLNLGTGIGYGDEDYTANGILNGGSHVYATGGLTLHLTETASLNAYITGTWAYGDLDDTLVDGEDVFGGASISVSF